MDLALIIISCSVVLQIISALFAIRLLLRPGERNAGLIILITITLMAFRRVISLYHVIIGDMVKTDLFAEIVALVVSILLLIGIVYITRLIKTHKNTAESLMESREVLEAMIETAPT